MDSELLGFASDARVLILNCDDLGLHEAVNAGVLDAIENGVATSCSLIAPSPAAADAIALLRQRPHVRFGVHLALIRDSGRSTWGPSAPKAEVPSLLDPATGELFTDGPINRRRLLGQARLEDVERELRAQLDKVVRAGLRPTHLDWHCLADGGRADIFDLGLALAEEYGLAARVWLDPGRQKARALGKPVVDHAFLDSFTVDVDSKPLTYERLLRALPSGLNEWAVHPALGSDEWQAIEPTGWRIRQSDHAFLTSDRARTVIAEEGIQVIDYGGLQNAWRRSSIRPDGPLQASTGGGRCYKDAMELFVQSEEEALQKAKSLRARGLEVRVTAYSGGQALTISGAAALLADLSRELVAQRRATTPHVLRGTVRWWKDEKGYGRITGDDGYIYFCHFSALQMEGYKALRHGQRVEFERVERMADHGRAGAANVRVIDSV